MTGGSRWLTAGWAAFALSGVLYLVSALRSKDWWSGAGAVVWIFGVGAFVAGARR
ncbi:MAG TPA: hypothetical protein VGC47_06240 [Acidimicrobiia bacterium]